MYFVKSPSDNDIIEEITDEYDVEIECNDRTGNAEIKSENSMRAFDCKNVIKSYNLGFNIKDSMSLFSDNVEMRVINLKSLSRNSKRLRQNKGRLIGRDGRTKEIIEELTDTKISISDNKVGVIGNIIDVDFCIGIIHKIMDGVDRDIVYRDMEKYNSTKQKSKREI